jgi:hypothetical protein
MVDVSIELQNLPCGTVRQSTGNTVMNPPCRRFELRIDVTLCELAFQSIKERSDGD